MTSSIASSQNENFRRWVELLSSRGIKKHSQFLIFGKKLVAEVLKENPSNSLELLTKADHSIPESLPSGRFRSFQLANELFEQLDVFGTNSPILVATAPDIPAWESDASINDLELLTPVGDPSNLGALLRSAQGFGVRKIVLLKESAHP